MDLALQAGLVFFLGVLVQCVSLIRRRPPLWAIGVFGGYVVLAAFVFMLPLLVMDDLNRQAFIDNIHGPVFGFSMVFAGLFLVLFHRSILKSVNEMVILSSTVSFWFLLLNVLGSGVMKGAVLTLTVLVGLFFTAISGYAVITKRVLGLGARVSMYVWFLMVSAFTAWFFLNSGPDVLALISGAIPAVNINFIDVFLAGMVVVYLTLNLAVLYHGGVIFLLDKRMRRYLEKNADEWFHPQQITVLDVLKVLVVQAGFLFGFQFASNFVSTRVLVLWIVVTPLFWRMMVLIRSR